MATIILLDEIKKIIESMDVIGAMEEGFKQYSNGNTIVPPVAELLFEDPPGEAHIKYGYIKKDDFYVIKIASGFYNNKDLGIPSSQGLMLLFNQKTGQLESVLLDEGHLTDIRTAAAGALAAKYFAPKKIQGIGIIGTGIQATMQLEFLLQNHHPESIWVWGRNKENAKQFQEKFAKKNTIRIAKNTSELASHCNLIVTTTPSENVLLKSEDIQLGTHITAVGSDTKTKQELDVNILEKADIVIADSLPQSKSRGEVFQAVNAGVLREEKVVELGVAIQDTALQRKNDREITVVDLTGVAVQDIMITKAVYLQHKNQ